MSGSTHKAQPSVDLVLKSLRRRGLVLKIVSEYDQEIPQSHIPDKLMHRKEEPHNHETPGRQTKQINQLPLPNQDNCKTRRDKNNAQKIEQLQTPTTGVTINNKSTTTEPPP